MPRNYVLSIFESTTRICIETDGRAPAHAHFLRLFVRSFASAHRMQNMLNNSVE